MTIQSFLLISTIVLSLTACSNQPLSLQKVDEVSTLQPIGTEQGKLSSAMPLSNLYHLKNGKRLKMVRIMEGGACKNDQEGVVGMFMLYADPDDIETVSQQQGTEIFAEFDQLLETIAMDALSASVNELEFDQNNPFALDEDELARTLAKQLIEIFQAVIADEITTFELDNGLIIDLVPLKDSLYFYRDGCEMPHDH
jgi:hypothetical protein